MKHNSSRHGEIRLGTHGEDYGNWMPVSMLRLVVKSAAAQKEHFLSCAISSYFLVLFVEFFS